VKQVEVEAEEMSERTKVQATPELPDETPLDNVELPTRIRNALADGGLETVGEVREASDKILVTLPNLGTRSVAHLRKVLGLSSTDGIQPSV
jgi:DNA-directed RNA polymerase alpha subunit